ncbi:MAG: ABC transporter permease [Cyclobacteriaceae bacterium]
MKSPNTHPPRLAEKLLCSFLDPELAEEVLGDLDEQYYATSIKKSPAAAKRNYWFQVLNYLRPFAIKRTRFIHSIQLTMFRNNLKIAWRSLLKQKLYSAIKIGGFAIGIAASILITIYIAHEVSYDTSFQDSDRIYRVIQGGEEDGEPRGSAWFPAPMASVLEEEYPEIEKAGRLNSGALFGAGSNEVRRVDKQMNMHEEHVVYADQRLLEILKPEFVHGNLSMALNQPNSIVITESKAKKYFDDANPLGKRLIFNNDDEETYEIGGVIKDFPANTHITYDMFISMTKREFWPGEQNYWGAQNYPTYVLLKPGTDIAALETKLMSIVTKYVLPAYQRSGIVNPEQYTERIKYELQPITDIHLNGSYVEDGIAKSDVKFVWLFGIIAAFIMIIASINFINLSTAKSASRAKEVGLRKVVGSYRINLIRQFLVESTMYSLLSFIMGLLLAIFMLPFFNRVADKSLSMPVFSWWFFPVILLVIIIIGLISGIYPAFYLSGFKPIDVLKGKLQKGNGKGGFRSLLVIFQFTTSIILIIGTVVIYQQVEFMLNKKLGYDKEQVLLLHGTGTIADKVPVLKNELMSLQDVQHVSVGDYLPVSGTKRNGNGFWKLGKYETERAVYGQFWRCDADYVETLGIQMVAGRDFEPGRAGDSATAVINQQMVKALNLENPIGAYITNGGSRDDGLRVIGVMEDFHFESLRGAIEPICLVLGESPGMVTVKVATENMAETITDITEIWETVSPNQPIRVNFLDESYELMYEDVKRSGYIFTSFAVLAIIVACLGLFALSAFMVEQRTKEIGIRLVLGASVNSIFRLLTSNFVRLIIISLVVAIPISYIIMQKWLEDFEYRISLTWDVFLLAGSITIVIAMLTISFESVKAGLMNPAKSLRSE